MNHFFKKLKYFVTAFIVTISLSSCFFTGNIARHSFSKEYINPAAQSVKHAALKDSVLYVTYVSKYKNRNSDSLYQFNVAIDSLIRYFDSKNQTIISFSNSQTKQKYLKLYEVWYSGTELAQFGKGLVIRLNDIATGKEDQERIQEEKYNATVSIIANDTLFNYDASEYVKKDVNGQYDKFIYSLNNNKREQFKFIVITNERKKKMHLSRLLLLPFSVCADIITFPVQAFIKITRDKLDRPAFFEFPNYIR